MKVKQQYNPSSSGHLRGQTSTEFPEELLVSLFFNITGPAGGYVKTGLSREMFFHVSPLYSRNKKTKHLHSAI